MTSKHWPQSTKAIETKCMKPLHLQDHKNESNYYKVHADHNNAKKIIPSFTHVSIDSWWKTSIVILSQVETKNNKDKTWWTKKVHDQAKHAYILSSPSW
jgi:hypothetical protein